MFKRFNFMTFKFYKLKNVLCFWRSCLSTLGKYSCGVKRNYNTVFSIFFKRNIERYKANSLQISVESWFCTSSWLFSVLYLLGFILQRRWDFLYFNCKYSLSKDHIVLISTPVVSHTFLEHSSNLIELPKFLFSFFCLFNRLCPI